MADGARSKLNEALANAKNKRVASPPAPAPPPKKAPAPPHEEEILMRYRKAPYTDEMGKKARNLALSYFMDHLTTHTLKLYKDRFKDAPEGQNNRDSHQRRNATIKSFCCDTIEDWAQKVALSSQAITSIQNKFIDLADQHLEESLSDLPDEPKAY